MIGMLIGRTARQLCADVTRALESAPYELAGDGM
jgi:hypothetical protein